MIVDTQTFIYAVTSHRKRVQPLGPPLTAWLSRISQLSQPQPEPLVDVCMYRMRYGTVVSAQASAWTLLGVSLVILYIRDPD